MSSRGPMARHKEPRRAIGFLAALAACAVPGFAILTLGQNPANACCALESVDIPTLTFDPAKSCCSFENTDGLSKTKKDLPTNVKFIVDAFSVLPGYSLEGFLRARPVLVSTDNDLFDNVFVPLKVVSVYGASHDHQVVVEPATRLKKNTKYKFKVRSPLRWDLWFSTGQDSDVSAPKWKGPPKVVGKEYFDMTPGPRVVVLVEVPVEDEGGPVFVLVDTTRPNATSEIANGPWPRKIFPVEGGKVRIGGGGCGDTYWLTPGEKYVFTISAMDRAGNVSPAPGGPIEIVGPAPGDKLPPEAECGETR